MEQNGHNNNVYTKLKSFLIVDIAIMPQWYCLYRICEVFSAFGNIYLQWSEALVRPYKP